MPDEMTAESAREEVAAALALCTAMLTIPADHPDLLDTLRDLLTEVPAEAMVFSLGWLVLQVSQMVAESNGGDALSVLAYLGAELQSGPSNSST